MCKMPVLPTAAQPWRRARVLSNQSSKNSPFLSFFLTILRQFGAFFAQFVKRQFYLNPGTVGECCLLKLQKLAGLDIFSTFPLSFAQIIKEFKVSPDTQS